MSLPSFHWLSRSDSVPPRWDLRAIGWSLLPAVPGLGDEGRAPCLLDWRSGSRIADWCCIRRPASVVAVGVPLSSERAQLLAAGLGDAVGPAIDRVELAARLGRVEDHAARLPRTRRAGPLTLDLFQRDARHGETWLGLHPREFALLWRLAETPCARVSRRDLLAYVWRREHVPETNSLEVHVSRLRAKLAIAHCAWLVRTHPDGGYQLGRDRNGQFRELGQGAREALDRPVAIGNCVPD